MISLTTLSRTCHVDSRRLLLGSSPALPCRRASWWGTVGRQGCRAVSVESVCRLCLCGRRHQSFQQQNSSLSQIHDSRRQSSQLKLSERHYDVPGHAYDVASAACREIPSARPHTWTSLVISPCNSPTLNSTRPMKYALRQ